MPPQRFSRFSFVSALTDDDGRVFLSDREPFRFIDLPDNRTHEVKQGDTLWSMANKFFDGIDRPAGLWWVIADFQPEPVFDPTVELSLGRLMFVPSLRTVLESIFSANREGEATP